MNPIQEYQLQMTRRQLLRRGRGCLGARGGGACRLRAVPEVLGTTDPGPALERLLSDFLEREDADWAVSGERERLAAVAGDAGCHACHTHQSCTERCPKRLAPTASIAGLKRASAWAAANSYSAIAVSRTRAASAGPIAASISPSDFITTSKLTPIPWRSTPDSLRLREHDTRNRRSNTGRSLDSTCYSRISL